MKVKIEKVNNPLHLNIESFAIYNDNNLYETLVTNGKLLVENEYNLKIFNTKVFKELGINE